jgi:hypothetical protein
MACCGQKRTDFRNNPSTAKSEQTVIKPGVNNWNNNGKAVQQTPVVQASAYSTVNLRYLENSPILVRGPVTGRQYEFSGAKPQQPVDVRDADALLRTGFFRKGI